MKKFACLIFALCAILVLCSCGASQSDYDELKSQYDKLSVDYDGLTAEYDELSAQYETLKKAYDERGETLDWYMEQTEQLTQQLVDIGSMLPGSE